RSAAAKSPRPAWQVSARAFRSPKDGGGPSGGIPGGSPRKTDRNPCCTPRMWATRERSSSGSRAGDVAQARQNTALAHSAWASRSRRNGSIGILLGTSVRDRAALIVLAGENQLGCFREVVPQVAAPSGALCCGKGDRTKTPAGR